MTEVLELQLESLDHTRKLAHAICAAAKQPWTIALNGTLGTGKTQFTRFFVDSLFALHGKPPLAEVTSPTYVLLQRYPTKPKTYHLDFYRLENIAQVWDLGIDEIFEEQAWVLIEWAEKFPQSLPEKHVEIHLQHTDQNQRIAKLAVRGCDSTDLFSDIANSFQS